MLSNRFTIIAGAALVFAAPAGAGEITGNGKDIDINGRSVCAYSGQNDTPDGDLAHGDPGGRVQSFCYLVGQWDRFNPQNFDPTRPGPLPGWSCNPNRGADLNAGH